MTKMKTKTKRREGRSVEGTPLPLVVIVRDGRERKLCSLLALTTAAGRPTLARLRRDCADEGEDERVAERDGFDWDFAIGRGENRVSIRTDQDFAGAIERLARGAPRCKYLYVHVDRRRMRPRTRWLRYADDDVAYGDGFAARYEAAREAGREPPASAAEQRQLDVMRRLVRTTPGLLRWATDPEAPQHWNCAPYDHPYADECAAIGSPTFLDTCVRNRPVYGALGRVLEGDVTWRQVIAPALRRGLTREGGRVVAAYDTDVGAFVHYAAAVRELDGGGDAGLAADKVAGRLRWFPTRLRPERRGQLVERLDDDGASSTAVVFAHVEVLSQPEGKKLLRYADHLIFVATATDEDAVQRLMQACGTEDAVVEVCARQGR